MANLEIDRERFNKRVDDLVNNVIKRNLGTAEYRAEYVKAANLYKRVAGYDPELATELWLSSMMLSYHFCLSVTQKLFK